MWFNKNFIRGYRDGLELIERIEIKGTAKGPPRKRKASSPADGRAGKEAKLETPGSSDDDALESEGSLRQNQPSVDTEITTVLNSAKCPAVPASIQTECNGYGSGSGNNSRNCAAPIQLDDYLLLLCRILELDDSDSCEDCRCSFCRAKERVDAMVSPSFSWDGSDVEVGQGY